MATVAVRYIGPQPERYLPDLGVTVERGAVVEVSEAFAGSESGEWMKADGPVDGWPSRYDEQGDLLIQDPGAGLLAQVDVWQRVMKAKSKPGPSIETAPSAQEG